MNKEQYKAHFRQRLTEEDLRDNPPDLETASGRIASGKPASYRRLVSFPLRDEDIDQAEDQDEIDSENNGTYGSPEHELRQEKREAQKEKNEKTREIADEVLMVMSGSRAGLGGDDDWDAARVNPDNYDPDDPFYNSQPPIYEKGSSTTRDIAAGISDLEMGIPGSAAKLAKRIEHWNIPKKPINDTSELIAAQAEKDIPGTHDQTYKDMEDVRIDAEKKVDAEKKSIKEQYKTYLRQRLYESDPQKYDDVGKKIDNETSEVKETPEETPEETPTVRRGALGPPNRSLESIPPRLDPTQRYLAPRTSGVDEPRQGQYGADIDISGDDTDIIVPTQRERDAFEGEPMELEKMMIRVIRSAREQSIKDGELVSKEDQAIKRKLGISGIISKDKLLLKAGEGIRNGTMKMNDPDPPKEPPEEMDEPNVG